MKTHLTTRREFLKQALAGTGLTLALTLVPSGYRLFKAEEIQEGAAFSPNAWIQITPDNKVRIIINKSEMGQGVSTALPMIAADELEADWKQVRFIESPAGPKYIDPESGLQLTGGSTSVRHMYKPLRIAGAAVREMLIGAAARAWSVPVSECVAVQGSVRHAKSGQSMTYGQLFEKAAGLPVPPNPPLKSEKQSRYIGHSLPRLDIPDKVNGTAIFGIDVSLPGMLYAALARPPAFGAKALAYDKEAAGKVPGVVQVAPVSHGVAEVAEVSVNEKEGKVTVHRVVCAIDCGPVVVNPAIIAAQAKGAIIQGLSAALRERIDFEKGGVVSANFYNYHELRISEAPMDIEVHILKNQEIMGGVGEPPLSPIAPAVANAVFAATGKRIRRLPLEGELKKVRPAG